MDWERIPRNESIVEMAVVVSEAEVVLDFGESARGWFRVAVFEDLLAADPASRFFARATEKEDPSVQAIATGASPEEAATLGVREAGVSLRRARGR